MCTNFTAQDKQKSVQPIEKLQDQEFHELTPADIPLNTIEQLIDLPIHSFQNLPTWEISEGKF